MARSTRPVMNEEYIFFMGSETLHSACCILPDESSILFYSTSNGSTLKSSTSTIRYPLLSVQREMEICKQQGEIEIYCFVGDRQI